MEVGVTPIIEDDVVQAAGGNVHGTRLRHPRTDTVSPV
jgi:hypothetical protein